MVLNSHKLSRIFMLIAWIILGTYCFIAFFPIPWGIGVGLDSSWQYALSRAAGEKLIFGKDIIFTYGPFGYLIDGAVWNQNFFSILIFRSVVHLLLFGVIIVKIVNLKTNLQKLSLVLSLFLPFIINLSIDYEILFAFIILLSSDSIFCGKYKNVWFLALGAVSGFCLLTKFTLGICTFGALILMSLANLYLSIKARAGIYSSIFSLLNLFFSATTVSFIFLNPNPSSNIKKILICLIISSIFGSSIWLIQSINNRRNVLGVLEQANKKTVLKAKLLRWKSASLYAFYTAYFICLLIAIFSTSPSLIDYLRSSLNISSGYSSAMSTVGSPWELGFAISEVILIFILLTTIASESSLGFSLGLAFVLWITFKHGFVRQDSGHIVKFILSTPLIVSLIIAKSKKLSTLKSSLLIHNYVLAIALVLCFLSPQFGDRVFQNLNYTSISTKASTLLNLKKLNDDINVSSSVNLDTVKLPQRVTSLLKDKKIDIVPWEISLVEANKLNWKPRPIFQSYSAYTSFLDNKNSESIIKEQRDYIIYQFLSIDGRHPFFDEPKTFFNILCNYKPSADVPNFVATSSASNLIILEKRKSSMCSSSTVGKTFSMRWKKSHNLETSDGFLVRAAVNIEYSIIGKIYKTIFRSPPVKIKLHYLNGSTNSCRIIPENSNNGVIISHLPENDSQALSLFQGQLDNPVKSFSFSTSNPLLYKPNINVAFASYKILEPAAKKQRLLIDISQLKSIMFLPTQTDKYMGFMDSGHQNSQQKSNAKPFDRGDVVSASGWATLKSSKGEKCWVLLTYGLNNKPLAITETGVPRPDVAKYFNKSEYTNSGWSINFSSEVMPKGSHDIKAWIYEPKNNSATPMSGIYHVEIR